MMLTEPISFITAVQNVTQMIPAICIILLLPQMDRRRYKLQVSFTVFGGRGRTRVLVRVEVDIVKVRERHLVILRRYKLYV